MHATTTKNVTSSTFSLIDNQTRKGKSMQDNLTSSKFGLIENQKRKKR